MKRLVCVAAVALLPFTAGLAKDTGAGPQCTLSGTWVAHNAAIGGYALVSYGGQSASSGTVLIDFPAWDTTLGGAFPAAVRSTLARGVWVRAEGATFRSTLLVINTDASGLPVWIMKLTARETFHDHCTFITVSDTRIEAFLPTQNPFADPPVLGPYSLDDHDMYPVVPSGGAP